MKQKIFLGATFYGDNAFSRKIDGFRSRFDSKYYSNPELHLALIPAFEIDISQRKSLEQSLVEELESFFFQKETYELMFKGMDVHPYKKQSLLYLYPDLDEEWEWCKESLMEICQSHVSDPEKKLKPNEKIFLTIGRFNLDEALHQAITEAKRDFYDFTSLPVKNISLFMKNQDQWLRQTPLLEFKRPEANL